ncbi:MAG: AAA family ATPase [Candidatus Micrarchaeia archaeon]|jgi:exonuclease SbcC
MLKHIELQNWKTHRSTSLDFAKGTNILVGQMGAGKSSVLDAIAFALFGKYPALQHRQVTVSDIITNRPVQMQEASVRLSMEIQGNVYDITRKIELNGTTSATISKNGSYLQSQPQRVNEQVEKILGIDYDLFMRAIYSEQNRLTYFLELSPGERKKEIDDLLGLSAFATAYDNTTSLINRINDRIEDLEGLAKSQDIEGMKKAKEELASKLADTSSKLGGKKLELEKASEKAKQARQRLEEAKAAMAKKQELGEKKAKLESKKQTLAKELEELKAKLSIGTEQLEKKLEEQRKRVSELSEQSAELEKKAKEALEAKARLNAEAEELAKKGEEAKKISERLKGNSSQELLKLAEAMKKELDSLLEEQAKQQAQISENMKYMEELKRHIAKCPVCERELTPELVDSLIASKQKAIDIASGQLARVSKEVEEKRLSIKNAEQKAKELELYEQKLAELGDVASRLEHAKEELGKAEKEAGELGKKKEEKARELDQANKELAKLEALHDEAERKKRYELELEDAERELVNIEKEIAEIRVSQEEIDKLNAEYTAASAEQAKLGAEVRGLEAMLEQLKAQLADKEKQLGEAQRLKEEIEKKKLAASELAKYKNALADTQVTLRSKMVEYINAVMQSIWPELYPYADYQGIRLEPTDDDYVLMLRTNRQGKEWEPVEAIASGGERSVACLAMRVAFALVLVPNLKWLILDEPTHNIDRQGIEKLVRAIGEALPKYIEQIFIITHDELLKQVPNARIYVFSRDKAEQGETQIEEVSA